MKLPQFIKKKKESLLQLFRFGIVGGVGTVINTLALYILANMIGLHYLIAGAIATETAIISNFIGNHVYTFYEDSDGQSLRKKFVKFQLVSMITLVGTLFILWALTNLFGQEYLLVWNLIAIVIMFLVNFLLNRQFTWTRASPGRKGSKSRPQASRFAFISFAFIAGLLLFAGIASADLVATSQWGYHPDGTKQVVVYTNATEGSFSIESIDGVEFTGDLVRPTDYDGNEVNCQGNNGCLIGDFSNFTDEGEYSVSASIGSNEPSFTISSSIYESAIPTMLEFYNALRLQNSDYHDDISAGYTPAFTAKADGSFIMESHQAALTLIRLGSAYRANPELFAGTSMQEEIQVYVDYLAGLQGLEITRMQPSDDGYENGFRLNADMKVQNAFVPGPTNLTTIDVYGPGSSPGITDADVPVTSMCGADDGSPEWDACIEYAQTYYKCQIDEVCLNMTYIEDTGAVTGFDSTDFSVARGWSTEFGCYIDVVLTEELFPAGSINPCLIFYEETDRQNTIEALFGFAQAIPAVHDADATAGEELFERTYRTYEYVDDNYATPTSGDSELGFWGASLFLLYNYTGNTTFLEQAHALRSDVGTVLVADQTNGEEFYWEEYVRHKQAIEDHGLTYEVSGTDPAEYFRGQIFFDWKDRGATSISKNGENVFQFDPNIRFQNSRFMLTEALIAAKANELYATPEPFIGVVADQQLSWLTGMNGVQEGVSLGAPLRSYSFIFGLAEDINPEQFHSRLLINTGYREGTSGQIVGTRGTGKQIQINGTDYEFLDARFEVLGQELGATGNGADGETKTEIWDLDQTFNNGASYIPGWINGAFDVSDGGEIDTIFNYDDTVNTYEFTESTNEIVATAIELMASLDAQKNGASRHTGVMFGLPAAPTEPQTQLTVTSDPSLATVSVDDAVVGQTPLLLNLTPGTYTIKVSKTGFEENSTIVTLAEGDDELVSLDLQPLAAESDLTVTTTPAESLVTINTTPERAVTSELDGTVIFDSLPQGTFLVTASKEGFLTQSLEVVLDEPAENVSITLEPIDYASLSLAFSPSESIVTLNGTRIDDPGEDGYLEEDNIIPGTYSIMIINGVEYVVYEQLHSFADGENKTLNITLSEENATLNVTSLPDMAELYIDGLFEGLTPESLELPAGSYLVEVMAEDYNTYTQNVTLAPGQTELIDAVLQVVNGSIVISTEPAGASILLDGAFQGTSDADGDFVISDVGAGEHQLTILADGYNDAERSVDVPANGSVNVSFTLSLILEGETDLTPIDDSTYGSNFHMLETETAFFEVEANDTVTWTVREQDFTPVPGTAVTKPLINSTVSNFSWSPGVLWTPRIAPDYFTTEPWIVTAETEDALRVWRIDVENLVNPFSTKTGDREATMQVFTNNLYSDYESVVITIKNHDGTVTNHSLDPVVAGTETDWKTVLGPESLGYGNNYLSKVYTFDNETNTTTTYNIGTARDTYFEFPSSDDDDDDSSSSSGGGGGGAGGGGGGAVGDGESFEHPFEVVYLTVSDDVIDDDDSLTITTDLRGDGEDIQRARLILRHPAGWARTEELTNVGGDRQYGTWEAELSAFKTGQYVVESVQVRGNAYFWHTMEVEDRSFYVVGDGVIEGEDLMIVYTVLSDSELTEPANVTFSLDARDVSGIESVTASVSGNDGSSQQLNLSLVSGDALYGTWAAEFAATESDTTYTVDSVVLNNAEDSRSFDIPDRSVYLAQFGDEAANGQSGLTGNVAGESPVTQEDVEQFLRKPLVPTLIAFAVMALALGIVYFTPGLRRRLRKSE